MRTLLNVIWLALSGIWLARGYALPALLFAVGSHFSAWFVALALTETLTALVARETALRDRPRRGTTRRLAARKLAEGRIP